MSSPSKTCFLFPNAWWILTEPSRFTKAWENCIIHRKFSLREASSAYTSPQKGDETGKMYWQLTTDTLHKEKVLWSAGSQLSSSHVLPARDALLCATNITQRTWGNEKCCKIGIMFWGEEVFQSKRELFGKVLFIIYKRFYCWMQKASLHRSLACIKWFNLTPG